MPNFPRLLYYLAGAMRRLSWNSDKLRKYQEKRLRSVVNYAYEFVPFYHKKFKETGIRPGDIRTVEDLNKLPIVRKDDMRKRTVKELTSREFSVRNLKIVRTSGSTGQPFLIYISQREDDWRKAIYMRANISCGQKPRDRWVVITAPHHFQDTPYFLRRIGIFAQTVVSVFSDTRTRLKIIENVRPDILDGYSGSLLLLAKHADKEDLNTIRPKILFGSAEFIDKFSRRFIEKVFDAPFLDQFGCAEIDRSAWQCTEQVGYHMDADSVITQFIDEDGQEVASEELGEVVYTSLFNHAMPFIRYAVGDIGTRLDDECPCERKLPLMRVVGGRRDSFLVFPNGNIVSPFVFWWAINDPVLMKKIERWQVIQEKLNLFQIYIKKVDEKVDEGNLSFRLINNIVERLSQGHIDASKVLFDVKFVDNIPLDKSGKLRTIISQVKMTI